MEINDERSLTAWLSDKPAEWAQVIALRAALRVLPYIGVASDSWLERFALLPFHGVITSWIQLTESSIDIFESGSRANAKFGGHSFDFAAYKESQIAAMAADVSYHSADAQTQSMHVVGDCVEAVTKAAETFRSVAERRADWGEDDDAAVDKIWYEVQFDCSQLFDDTGSDKAGMLAIAPLWRQYGSEPFDDWSQLSRRLRAIDLNYQFWSEWHLRRVRGERAAFDIPGDQSRTEDREILRRLADENDEGFWDRGHEHVNATLQGWLDEARARVALEHPPAVWLDLDAPYELPAQNRNALSFRTDEQGRIAIDASALADRLRADAGARERHKEAVSEARIALDRCRGNNAAARLSGMFENYLAAAGDALVDAKPSLLVQRGERLRQELTRYEAPDHMLTPVADDLLLDLKGWQSAHNMMVGLDPALMAIDTAMLGPDRKPTLIPPDEIRQIAHDAEEAEILADGTEAIVVEAADLAPVVPDLTDRRSISSAEVAKNLIIEVFAVALNYPKTAGALVVAGATLTSSTGAGLIGGISIVGSIKAAEYLVNHRQWIEDRFGNTSTWQTLFRRVADWLEKVTPFKPK